MKEAAMFVLVLYTQKVSILFQNQNCMPLPPRGPSIIIGIIINNNIYWVHDMCQSWILKSLWVGTLLLLLLLYLLYWWSIQTHLISFTLLGVSHISLPPSTLDPSPYPPGISCWVGIFPSPGGGSKPRSCPGPHSACVRTHGTQLWGWTPGSSGRGSGTQEHDRASGWAWQELASGAAADQEEGKL